MVVDGEGPSLFGQNWLRVIKLDWAQFNKVSRATNDRMEGILKKHAAVFEPGLGTAKAKLYPKKDAKPIFCRPRQVSYAIRQKVEQKIERQVAEGIIEPSNFLNGKHQWYLCLRRMVPSDFAETTRLQ